jgi:hypothetical protein
MIRSGITLTVGVTIHDGTSYSPASFFFPGRDLWFWTLLTYPLVHNYGKWTIYRGFMMICLAKMVICQLATLNNQAVNFEESPTDLHILAPSPSGWPVDPVTPPSDDVLNISGRELGEPFSHAWSDKNRSNWMGYWQKKLVSLTSNIIYIIYIYIILYTLTSGKEGNGFEPPSY